jgi:hypothetical protein
MIKYIIVAVICLTVIPRLYSQVIPVDTFTVLLGQQLSHIDDRFTKDFRTELGQIDESKGVFSWKKGFNGDRSQNNQHIIYKRNDSTYEFWYDFVTDLTYGQNNLKTYYDYYENELNNSKYKRLEDSIEDWGYKAIVKNYQFDKYLIKLGKLATTNSSMIKIILRR